ncbi:YceI family protein [Flexithrix dorotheae]|uniref:YceI family protein n=1 Tax=Flexithrix dorotheae TaxID=70993 RepID=UPI00035D1BBE|nr:YceI family protein [Flexithrix dorotheae]
MNKHFLIITFLISLSSCIGKHDSDAQKATITEKNQEIEYQRTGDTIRIDLTKSNIHWKGTKMSGAGKHEGKIELKSGFLIINNKQLISGNFVIDMTTIGVTDIPEHEPIPRNNLNNHLKSPDFFDVEKFPTSEFQITNVHPVSSDSLLISGNLTLKDITKSIGFGAKYQGKSFKTRFTFDRFQWNIAYEGNFADKTLVDKDIELTINLKME